MNESLVNLRGTIFTFFIFAKDLISKYLHNINNYKIGLYDDIGINMHAIQNCMIRELDHAIGNNFLTGTKESYEPIM